MTGKLGETVSFRCEASGFPAPRLQWFKKNMKSDKIDHNFDLNDDDVSSVVELPGYLTHAVTQVHKYTLIQ